MNTRSLALSQQIRRPRTCRSQRMHVHRAMACAIAVVALLACNRPAPVTPTPTPAPPGPRVVALISANVEWKIVRGQFPEASVLTSPFGEWFVHRFGAEDVVFFHGGYGKVASASSTQYAIDRWHPALLVNLGTCGGFGGERKVGDIVLVNGATIYDIYDLMGYADESIADYQTALDTTAWPARLADRVVVGGIVSGDRDLDPAAVAGLRAKYHATVGDWESGSIAWVARRNGTRVIILRGVSDLVDASQGDAAYEAGAWERASVAVMASLIALLGDALPDLVR